MVETDGKTPDEKTSRDTDYDKCERLLSITKDLFPGKEIWRFDSGVFFMIVECSSCLPIGYKREILIDPVMRYIRVFHRDYLKEASRLEEEFHRRMEGWFTLKEDY